MNHEIYEPCSVELVQGCVNGDLLVVNAARASFAKAKTEITPADTGLLRYLATGFRTEEWAAYLNQVKEAARADDDALLERLMKAYRAKAVHWAPFGHPHITLRLVMPVFLARQFVKHQVGGVWSEASRRYLDDKWTFYKEPEWHSRPDDIKQGSGAALADAKQWQINAAVDQHIQLSLGLYDYMRKTGVAPEEAREIMPLNHMTTIVWTGSLLFWVRVVQLRVEAHAQLAAQELGKQIADQIETQCPLSWNALMR